MGRRSVEQTEEQADIQTDFCTYTKYTCKYKKIKGKDEKKNNVSFVA